MTLYVYRRASAIQDPLNSDIEGMRLWKPTPSSWIPPGKHSKYFLYSAFHWLHVFGNRHYRWLTLNDNGMKASMLCVPVYFRWPFMDKNDIQFVYVITDSDERSKGWGSKLLEAGLRVLSEPQRTFWYVTDAENIPSQNLALRSGFHFVGTAVYQQGFFKQLQVIGHNESDSLF